MQAAIIIVSIVLQLAAAVLLFRLTRVTGHRPAWIILSLGIALMAARRTVSLYRLLSASEAHQPDFGAELLAVTISLLLLLGIAGISPILRHLQRTARLLRKIVEGTSQETGQQFFRSVVEQIASALKVSSVVVAAVDHDSGMLRPLAAWDVDRHSEDQTYDLGSTASEAVCSGHVVHYRYWADAADEFPHDELLAEMRAQSYLGVPLLDPHDVCLGVLCVMDVKPLAEPVLVASMLKVFAARAAGELLRGKAETALRRSEAMNRAVLDNVAEAIIRTDTMGEIHAFNPGAEHLFGCSQADALGNDIGRFVPSLPGEPGQEASPAQASGHRAGGNRKVVGVRSDGGTFPAEAVSTTMHVGSEHWYVTIVRDETERRRARAELEQSAERMRRLATHLQAAQEEERTRVAREIHDELGQELTVLKMNIAWLASRSTSSHPDAARKFTSTSNLADTLLGRVRSIVAGLRPGVLDHLGLAAALEWHVREFGAQTGLECRTRLSDSGVAVDADQSVALYRVCQEALTNVARHATATTIDVSLEVTEDRVVLEIRDDGRGITANDVAAADSHGIAGMRERVAMWGGQCAITGAPGQGTVVRVELPRPPDAPAGSPPQPMIGASSIEAETEVRRP